MEKSKLGFEINHDDMLELLGLLQDVLNTKRLAKTSRARLEPVVKRLVAEVEKQYGMRVYDCSLGRVEIPGDKIREFKRVYTRNGKHAAILALRLMVIDAGQESYAFSMAREIAKMEGIADA